MSAENINVNHGDKLLTWKEYTDAFQLVVGLEVAQVVVHPSTSITFHLRKTIDKDFRAELEVGSGWTFWCKGKKGIIMRTNFGEWSIAREAQAVFNTVQATFIKKIKFINDKVEGKRLHIFFSDGRELIVFHIDDNYFASLLINDVDEYALYEGKCWFSKIPPNAYQGDK